MSPSPEPSAFAPAVVPGTGEDRVLRLLESITDRFYAFDAEWRFTYLNAAAKRGLAPFVEDPSALLGQNYFERFPATRGTVIEESFKRAVATASMVEFETFYEPWSRWFSCRCFPIEGGGLSVYFRDVTEERRTAEALRVSEAKYRRLFDSVDSAFCVIEMIWDARGEPVDYRFLEVNANFARHNGLHDAVGRTALEMIPDLESRWFEAFGRVSRTGVPSRFIEGSEAMGRWFDLYAFPMGTGNGCPVAVLFNDITERRRDEETLRNAKATLTELAEQRRLALDSAQMGWWHFDPVRGVVKMDERFKTIFGVGDEVMAHEKVRDRIHPEDQPRVIAGVEAATRLDDPVPYSLEYRLGPVGEEPPRWVLAKGRTTFEGEGTERRAVSLVGTVVDITEAKMAQDALRESEERFRTLFNSINAGFCEIEMLFDERERPVDYRFLMVNPAFEGMTGLNEVLGKRIRELVPNHEEHWFEVFGRVALTGKSARFEERAEGLNRWYEVYAYRVGDPARRRVAVLFNDVSERRQAEAAQREREERFRQLADAMPQIVWAARPDGILDYTNRRWYEYLQQTEAEVSPADWHLRVHPEDIAEAAATWARSTSTGQPYFIEFRVRGGGDSYRWFLTRALPIRDETGTIMRWYGTCTDIDDQRALLEQNAQLLDSERAARSEAERVSRMKDEFLATLSHELRTPLNAILGWSQVLRSDLTNLADVEQGLLTIERNARAQTQIIEDLLDMSRIISGKVRLDVQRLDLCAVVGAAVETLRPAAAAKDIRLQAVLDPGARWVGGDPNRLQQVFWNLLSNAIKFTPKGGRVQVMLECVHSHLEVSVTDSGEGIAPGFLAHVFERFRQADSSSTRRHGGLGLGLAIVKQLVELHGGTVRAESAGVGQGTTFRVMLPLTALQPHPDPDEVARRHPRTGGSAPDALRLEQFHLDGVKVLVVDDEPDVRNLVRRLLEDREARVQTAGSAAEALQLLRLERPDVLISDIGMPGEDGYAFIRQVRALSAGQGGATPAIALTAYARSEDRLKAILAGFQMHLAKPVEATELLAMVTSLAGRVTRAGR